LLTFPLFPNNFYLKEKNMKKLFVFVLSVSLLFGGCCSKKDRWESQPRDEKGRWVKEPVK